MCGLVGFLNENGDEALLNEMCKSILYKKWYRMNKYIKDRFAAGRVHNGLLNPQPQPIFNENKNLLIFMDGEIFNYDKEKEKLKRKGHKFKINNDIDFCLHLFEEEGENFVKKLNGNFIIIIFDIENQKLMIFNDMGGLIPFFYFHEKGNLIFGSEIKAILQNEIIKREINDDAIADFFTFGRPLGDKTFFKGIKLLPPASIFSFKEGRISIKKYWDFVFNASSKTENYYIDRTLNLLKKSINIRLGKHKQRSCVALSGGLDSRLIGSLIENKDNLKTISYGHGKIHDVIIANTVSKLLNSEHISLNLIPDSLADFIEKGIYISEGMINSINFTFLPVIKEIKEKFDFIITAAPLGELLGDLPIDETLLSLENNEEIINYIYNNLSDEINLVNEKYQKFLFSKKYYKKIRGRSYNSLKSEIEKENKEMNAFDKIHSFLMKNVSRQVIFFFSINFGECGIEHVTPVWDKEFMNFILKIPCRFRTKRYIEYKMLRRSSKKLSNIPYNRTGIPFSLHARLQLEKNILKKIVNTGESYSFLPDGIEFMDYARAIRESDKLKDFFKKILLNEKTLNRGYFNKRFVKKIFENHLKGKGDYHRILFAILTFEFMLRLFFD